ncbi:hypothetical protein CBL_09847 [Carabus blaptoides fortunei]
MEPIPLIPESKFKSNPDTSQVLREEFQDFLGHGEFSKKIAENLAKFTSEKYDLKYCGTEVNNICNHSKKYYEDITNAEYTLLKTQAKYLQEKAIIEKCPLKMETYLPNFEDDIVRQYSLIQAKDLLPHDTEQILNCRLNLKTFPARTSCWFIEQKRQNTELMTDIKCYGNTDASKLNLPKQSGKKMIKKTTKKVNYYKNRCVFLARPKRIIFYNYEKHVLYEHQLFLLNITTRSQTFTTPELPADSKFRVTTVSTVHKIAPGMCAQFTIHFSPDSLTDCEEWLIIRVRGSQPVVVGLFSCRYMPIVRGILYRGNLDSVEDNSSPVNVNPALNYTIDCGSALLGYSTEVTFVFRNYGGKGTFFIVGEEDWIYRDVNSISTDYQMTLKDFTISPVYFKLDINELREIKIGFQPGQKGLCLEKVFILCDNTAYKELDLIGDCLVYETNAIQLNIPQEYVARNSQIDKMKYSLDLGKAFARQKVSATIFMRNISNINLRYEWRKWTPCECDCEEIYLIEDHWIRLDPADGSLKQDSETYTDISVCVDSQEPGVYVYVLCLYALNIPASCLNKDEDFQTEITKENCKCVPQLCNIRIEEVEIQIEIIELNVHVWPQEIRLEHLLVYDTESLPQKVHITNETPRHLALEWTRPKSNDFNVLFHPKSFKMEAFSSTICKLSVIPHTYNNINTECSLKINQGIDDKKIVVKATVERPQIKLSQSCVNFAIVRRDSEHLVTIRIDNDSNTAVYWNVMECKFNFDTLEFTELTDANVDVNCGELCHRDSYCDVTYRLDTSAVHIYFSILVFFISFNACEKYESGATFIMADVQEPDVHIQNEHYQEPIFQIDEVHYQNETVTREFYLHNYSPFECYYTWGEPCGLNKHALTVQFDYNCGKLYANSRKKVEIRVCFREIGRVSDFLVPCSIQALDQPVFLQICCQIKGAEVWFSIPVRERRIEVVWQNEYPKYEGFEDDGIQEEQELSLQEYVHPEDQINSLSSSNLSHVTIKPENDKTLSEDSKILQYYPDDIISYLKSIEIEDEYESCMKSSTKEAATSSTDNSRKSDVELCSVFGSESSICRYVIEFANVPCKQVVKQTIDITNNMKIPLQFSVAVKNFKAKRVCRTKFDNILLNMKLKTDDRYTDQLSSHGIFISCEPETGELYGVSTVSVEFSVYAETWGKYLEEVTIELPGLPTFYLNLVINVVGFPLEYPVLRNTNLHRTEPIVQFGNVCCCSKPQRRIVTVHNASTIPCTIVFHLFTKHIADKTKGSINVMLDIFNTVHSEPSSVECKLKIMKYFGRQQSEEFTLFTVEPSDVYIEARETKYISVTIKPQSFKEIFEEFQLSALLVGHVYIDKIYRNYSNFIIRNPDKDLKPIKIPIFAQIECWK